MLKKILMFFLAICFVSGIVLLILFFQKRIPNTTVNLPLAKASPTPIVSLAPVPTIPPQIPELDADLIGIEKDLEKMNKEDPRFSPPVFIFDLGLK